MREFRDIVADAARGVAPMGRDTVAALNATVDRYPWFTTARVLRAVASATRDSLLELHLSVCPIPSIMLHEVTAADFGIIRNNMEEELIERFLQRGDYRIVPDTGYGTAEENAAAGSEKFDPTGSAVSEQLAEIYLAQGLNNQAREIYEQLCLQNPEKSIYFAEIIAAIPRTAQTKGGRKR
jgi:hypothetical protein